MNGLRTGCMRRTPCIRRSSGRQLAMVHRCASSSAQGRWHPNNVVCSSHAQDVPTYLPAGTVLPCNLPREDVRDVFISDK